MKEGDSAQRGPAEAEKVLNELGIFPNNVYISDVYDARNKHNGLWRDEDFQKEVRGVKDLLKKERSTLDPIIIGPAEIAQGQGLTLAITSEQLDAFAIIYDFDVESPVSYYASIESLKSQKKIEEVLIKFGDIKPQSVDNLVISESLAEALELKKGEDLRISAIYQRAADVNLDNL